MVLLKLEAEEEYTSVSLLVSEILVLIIGFVTEDRSLQRIRIYARNNKGYRYILVVINVFSKYVWAETVKRKTGKDMKGILRNCQSDLGKEFYNADFRSLIDKFKINHYSTFYTLKASVVEKVNRTLKNLIWRQSSLRGSYKWINILQNIVNQYNNTIRSTHGLKPKQINNWNAKKLLRTVYSHLKTVDPVTYFVRAAFLKRHSDPSEWRIPRAPGPDLSEGAKHYSGRLSEEMESQAFSREY
ncbi:hypothetical protein NQ315_006076 [Exocentrus adspersus]|uniref:Integrase catalytic domain-containing protein n=1 Tax=Exocentrus adspersus TaxID=1586481 RepID=A0AAV8VG60_9CUCU|nr:hypothetical protein NQ315_006076 [Exocentrus adspersus]